MNEIITTVEAAIKSAQWDFDYHIGEVDKASDKVKALKTELAELKSKFGIKDENHCDVGAFDNAKTPVKYNADLATLASKLDKSGALNPIM